MRQFGRLKSRTFLAVGVAAALVAAVGGAGMATSRAAGALANAHPASTSTLTIWYSTDDPVETNWAPGLVSIFEKTHPKIKVEMKVYDLDDFNDKMQDALGSNTGPDLAYATPREPAIPIYIVHHELLNLTSYASKNRWASLLRPGLLDFWNAPFKVWSKKATNLSGDAVRATSATQIYGVPDAMAADGVAYNTDLMNKLGISFPKTLADLESDAAKAKAAGMIPFGIGNNDLWLGDDWYIMLANEDFSVSQLQKVLSDGSFNFNQSAFVKAGNLMSSWSKDGYLTPNFQSLDAQGGMDSFFRGNTLFQLMSSSEDAQLLEDEQETKMPITVEAFPASFTGYTGLVPYSGYEGWIVPKATHNKSAAIKWINFMLSDAATQYTMKNGVLPTTNVPAADAPTQFQKEFLNAFAGARRGIYLDAAPVPNFTANMEGNIDALLAGKESGAAVAKDLEKAYKSYGRDSNKTPDIDGEY